MRFLQDNWPLVLLMVGSGVLLLWSTVQRYLSPMREVGAMEATQLINRRDALMLDVREAKEYQGGRIANALHVPSSELANRGDELKKYAGRPVVVYCDRGQRSRRAGSTLARLGFAEVYALRGGLRAWSDAGLPVDKAG